MFNPTKEKPVYSLDTHVGSEHHGGREAEWHRAGGGSARGRRSGEGGVLQEPVKWGLAHFQDLLTSLFSVL